MINFLKDGLNGKKVKVNDVANAIKEVQEEQFNTGKFKGLTGRFKMLSDKFEAAQVHKLQQEGNVAGKIAIHYGKKVVAHTVASYTGGVMTAGKLAVASTVAAKLAKAAKSSNLAFAKTLSEMVESGELTEKEADQIIADRFNAKGAIARSSAPALNGLFQSND
ncbi:hypothetical protein ACV3J7_19700 [Salmonella enterica]